MLPRSVWLLSIVFVSTQATIEYQCTAYRSDTECMIENVFYHPGQQISFPNGFRHFRFGKAKYMSGQESNITTFDGSLYKAMHRPESVEMTNVKLKHVVLPETLKTGSFASNQIQSIETDVDKIYQITILDLDSNLFSNISNISALINLEVLNLQDNEISTVDESVFLPLIKLKRLYLSYNPIQMLPWNKLPPSLTHLDCYSCSLRAINFTNSSFPYLEYLNLQRNYIQDLNVTQILVAAPNLKEAYLVDRQTPKDTAAQIVQILQERGITHHLVKCSAKEQYADGRCTKSQSVTGSVWLVILITSITVLIVTLVVYLMHYCLRESDQS
ncbi:leucine-rich repeat-containing protein 15-like [Malaya genurostris]|uniref:leucine-rich repeat-containing protein 15-like n=1 Tax=Malaya genurostris TaxID=325434 RepID=UPI0026F39284|nr:leucine-rich repeat-containing protein 15-like [Malaya genurostris]